LLLQQWVSEQAARAPDAVAVVCGAERLTYGQLEEQSNRLARLFRAQGCQRGDRICLLIPKSLAAIVAIHATLKADAVYVPLDTSSPVPRLLRIIEAADTPWIVAAGDVHAPLDALFKTPGFAASHVLGWMSEDACSTDAAMPARWTATDVSRSPAEPLDYDNASHDAAHILFTSGSTGAPKGVVITHDNVIGFIRWAVRYFGTSRTDRISGHPPLHFDLSTFDIFATFAGGAELHLVPPELNLLPHKLAQLIRDAALTQWFSVPAALNYMAKFDAVRPGDFPALRRLLWCGEVLPTPTLRYFMQRLPQVRFTNLYGPTETTIASSYYTVPRCPATDTEPIPVGQPCAGEELLVLDEELRPVAAGEVGDLYIAGVGLSPGYWRDPAKTHAAFFARPGSNDPKERLYRTGDRARLGEDGLVYFLGRTDMQIKTRGYRVELGEVESALHALGLVRECAVVGVAGGGFEGTVICCAFVPGAEPVTAARLREGLARLLPSYMLPSRWLELDVLPKNINGKIDRPALRESFLTRETQPA
jgi:amino acid adenylation domain-containing protein